MKIQKRKSDYDPMKVFFIIIVLAGALVLGDNFMGSAYREFTQRQDGKPETVTFDDIAELQRTHEKYMTDGILPPQSRNRPAQDFAKNDLNTDNKVDDFDLSSLARELPKSVPTPPLQDIEPASGTPDVSNEVLQKDVISEEIPTTQENVQGIKIAIIIDDMGLSLRSRQIEIMPYPLTLSYLPYAKNLKERTKIAKANGHELMVHIPMEALGTEDEGERFLGADDTPEKLKETMHWALSQFEGYVGVNNHMGSRMTQDRDGLEIIMKKLKEKDLYFIDSKTVGSSIAEDVAAEYGLRHGARDVFLDHTISRSAIDESLAALEEAAQRNGFAIAIGHPHKETIEALREWLPTLAQKGISLVPASSLVTQNAPAQKETTPQADVVSRNEFIIEKSN